jgi:hypothetical protein
MRYIYVINEWYSQTNYYIHHYLTSFPPVQSDIQQNPYMQHTVTNYRIPVTHLAVLHTYLLFVSFDMCLPIPPSLIAIVLFFITVHLTVDKMCSKFLTDPFKI